MVSIGFLILYQECHCKFHDVHELLLLRYFKRWLINNTQCHCLLCLHKELCRDFLNPVFIYVVSLTVANQRIIYFCNVYVRTQYMLRLECIDNYCQRLIARVRDLKERCNILHCAFPQTCSKTLVCQLLTHTFTVDYYRFNEYGFLPTVC